MKKFDPSEIEILDKTDPIIISNNENAIIFSKIKFKGNTYLDIRKYYLTEAGEYKPTSKGIWIPFEGEGFTIEKVLTEAIEFIK